MAPDLPELQLTELADDAAGLVLEGALVEGREAAVEVERLDLLECELRGVTVVGSRPLELRWRDVVLRDCDLSNVAAREGAGIARAVVQNSRLIGVGLAGSKLRDALFRDCMVSLGSFAFAELRDVSFERVNLREATFMNARLEDVSFIDCQIEGADFRGASLRNCLMRGSSLEGVLGVESLRGLTMPWNDVLASASALASAAGIVIEE